MNHLPNDTLIKVYRNLITLTGSTDGGVLLSYLIQCQQENAGDWFVRTREHCWFDTGIKKDRQITLCKHFVALGLIETKIKGLPACTHYRVVLDLIKQKMAALQQKIR